MKKSQTELTYLRSAAQNATAVGLVIILYDLLTHDLELAITALADRDVERRTAEIKHSFLVLQQLEGSLDMEGGGEEAKRFSAFYSALRCKIMEAHIKASPEILRQQVELVVEVRQAWQQVDPPNLGTVYSAAGMLPTSQVAEFSNATGGSEVSSNTWTA
jgi:flagellar secretion chaperone FliS